MSVPSVRVLVRAVAWMVVFFVLAAAGAAWFTPEPDLDAHDAADVALGALEAVGFEGTVNGDVELMVHTGDSGREVQAWSVPIEVDGEQIELRVQESAGQLVYVDDRIGPDDTERLLTDEQYRRFEDYRDDSVLDGWVQQNIAGSVAAVVIAGTAFVIARRSARIS